MKPGSIFAISSFLFLTAASPASAQNPDIKFITDTLVVQSDGFYEADPDLATLTFEIAVQDKELKPTYDRASQSLQKILSLAEKNGVVKADVSTGALTVKPFYEGDRKKKARSYLVQGLIRLRVRDFSKLGPILESSVDDGIADFRSLTYSLSDEEGAKQKAVAEAMRRAMGRASAALQQKGQTVGALRFANLDVGQLVGTSEVEAYRLRDYGIAQSLELESAGSAQPHRSLPPPPPPPIPQPDRITVKATVQCAFQIQ